MVLRLRVFKRAEFEIRAASKWWTENRPSAPKLFREDLQRAFGLITTQPGVGSPALDAGLEDVRRLHLDRVRYHMYYRVSVEGTVEVLAFWHTSRGRGPNLQHRRQG